MIYGNDGQEEANKGEHRQSGRNGASWKIYFIWLIAQGEGEQIRTISIRVQDQKKGKSVLKNKLALQVEMETSLLN